MDRFEFGEAQLISGETPVIREKGVKLYDGDDKTPFENGEVMLTSHRLLWGHAGDLSGGRTCLSLPLRYVVFAEEESSGFGFSRSRKVMLHLSAPLQGKLPGPVSRSRNNFIKLSFKEGLENDFMHVLSDTLQKRKWEVLPTVSAQQHRTIKLRTGIVGIERSIQERQRATDESITAAFQDLSKLMTMAKDMVNLSRNISHKIKEKQGDITEDETVRFKSYLLSLGIEDPVTRDSFHSDSRYHQELAGELARVLEEPIKEAGGMMALTDAYCRANRARGMELVSPEDLLGACKVLDRSRLPLRFHEFESGVMVLQLQSHSIENIVQSTKDIIEEKESITAEELAQFLGISVLLAKERLKTTENHGKACRDETLEGLRFYPNLFLQND
ncbi:vacuolar protein-sorting-associated protein 36 [Bacillus rossius redtenbacheri]|uniref:vacuolar protein-sorting-associated protein 36 n=1 Tax=Bacillus rossius redtenbacheri TaxID=93214 RepID=UPI002FDECE44